MKSKQTIPSAKNIVLAMLSRLPEDVGLDEPFPLG